MPIVTNFKAKDFLGMKEEPENILTHLKKMFKKDVYPYQNSNYFIVKSHDVGKPGIFSLNVQPVIDSSENIDSYVFIIRDITSNAAVLFDWTDSPEPYRLE